jgi:hypothetical protein
MDEIPRVLHGPLVYYKQERDPGEGFGDFCRRKGLEAVRAASERISGTGGNGNGSVHASHAKPPGNLEPAAPANGTPAAAQTKDAKPKQTLNAVVERDNKLVFPLYFKGKEDGAIVVPRNLNAQDCQMIELALQQIRGYTQQEG